MTLPSIRPAQRTPEQRLAGRWSEVRVAVDAELGRFLARSAEQLERLEPAAAPLADVVCSLARSGGKRFRPLLVRYGHLLAGGEEGSPAELRVACAVELVHTFALLQDDVIDGSAVRRGRPSGLARLGTAGAILASDLALTWADQLLEEAPVPDVVAARVREQVRELRRETIVGEFLDACVPGAEVGLRRRYVLKTARYTVTRPLLIGALLGPRAVELPVLQTFGDAVGVCFQLRDDELDGEPGAGAGVALADEVTTAEAVLRSLPATPGISGELGALIRLAARRDH